MSTKMNRGFTLIELMIVVQIIALIAAIAIPTLIRARIASNQTTAVGNLYALSRAQVMFSASGQGYASTFESLRDEPLARGEIAFLDIDLKRGANGYVYTIEPAGATYISMTGDEVNSDYHARANPLVRGSFGSGVYSYFINSTGALRFSFDGIADDNDEII